MLWMIYAIYESVIQLTMIVLLAKNFKFHTYNLYVSKSKYVKKQAFKE